jgi:hypothetical protein
VPSRGVLGEKRVNVLALNLTPDTLKGRITVPPGGRRSPSRPGSENQKSIAAGVVLQPLWHCWADLLPRQDRLLLRHSSDAKVAGRIGEAVQVCKSWNRRMKGLARRIGLRLALVPSPMTLQR